MTFDDLDIIKPLKHGEPEPVILCKNKWLWLLSIDFKTSDGKYAVWDMCARTAKSEWLQNNPGKQPHQFVDGTTIIPVIKRKGGKDLLLVAEYRCPVQGRVLSFPGGLNDEGECAGSCAMRELKEETGYTPSHCIKESLPDIVSYNDPWKSNETENIVIVEIDGEDIKNLQPKQELETDEEISVVVIPNLGPNTLDDAALICNKYNIHMASDVRRFLTGIKYASMI